MWCLDGIQTSLTERLGGKVLSSSLCDETMSSWLSMIQLSEPNFEQIVLQHGTPFGDSALQMSISSPHCSRTIIGATKCASMREVLNNCVVHQTDCQGYVTSSEWDTHRDPWHPISYDSDDINSELFKRSDKLFIDWRPYHFCRVQANIVWKIWTTV